MDILFGQVACSMIAIYTPYVLLCLAASSSSDVVSLSSVRSRLSVPQSTLSPTPSHYSSRDSTSSHPLTANNGVSHIMSLTVPTAAGAAGVTLHDHKGKSATPKSLIKKARSIGKEELCLVFPIFYNRYTAPGLFMYSDKGCLVSSEHHLITTPQADGDHITCHIL